MLVLDATTWTARAAAHEARVDAWVRPHLERRGQGVAHPVEDFLFTYYSQRPAALRRWHPGYGVALADAPSYGGLKGYAGSPARVTHAYLSSQRPLLETLRRLLTATADRAPNLGCFGLHEWAMVYRLEQDDVRHASWPLRLGPEGTDRVVETHRVGCSHFDAFRFFTPDAVALNVLSPGRDDRDAFEQPGCLHAGMDLYKHAFRLSPWSPLSSSRTASSWRGTSAPSTCGRRRTTSAGWATSPCASKRPRESRSTPRRSAGSPSAPPRSGGS
ncbi:MAG TPA: 3-methyladenine DNA glycosylase [Nocardioidaceae bacterium]|nr:3-methyladenine DNA glycosylase [Nocardioidaceae bacterium]